MKDFANREAFVTGAASGIGRTMAISFLKAEIFGVAKKTLEIYQEPMRKSKG